jgi:hydrogenase maturation protein HypF
MTTLSGSRIRITGIVQGVGFRPFVYNLAMRMNLRGWVRNTSAGVDIQVDGDAAALSEFARRLREEAPPLALIAALEVESCSSNEFATFEILHSEPVPGAFQPISPDVSICKDCLRELFDPDDARYLYPFINCTNCGPRFTIIQDIPYDRPKTTMAPFAMCPTCRAEYEDPTDRRFHAQPVACPDCGPKTWLEVEGLKLKNESQFSTLNLQPSTDFSPIQQTQQLLANGRILAIKGLGGFHLACDATNAAAVEELRRRKLRVDKPFALMMPDLATIEQHCIVSKAERELLTSRQRPIVLLERRPDSPIAEAVAPGQNNLGVMLPYTPLHYLLFHDGKRTTKNGNSPAARRLPSVLVMTSGNLSEEPIAYTNNEARERLNGLADAFLMHNREIHVRCDDSVVRAPKTSEVTTSRRHDTFLLRRSRGYAPFPVILPCAVPPILATGPELKNTFCLAKDRYAFLSHHIGDMENYETLQSFEQGIEHFERLFRIQPELIACDLHPNYLATRYALERAERENVPTFNIQHHHAHIAACMADNGLSGDEPVIGVSFDGTGYGDDGAVWGGEFLIADYSGYQRCAHLAYTPLPGGDKAVREPWRMALSWLHTAGIAWDGDLAPVAYAKRPQTKDSRQSSNVSRFKILRHQLERGVNAPPTSSAGRLFDAVAALAGVRQTVNYEAQAAIEFENLADASIEDGYPFEHTGGQLNPRPMLMALIADLRAGVGIPIISARFHNGLAQAIIQICLAMRAEYNVNKVALSGGVWQNMTLLERSLALLEKEKFEVLIHTKVPANDGGLSLGQAMIAARQLIG